MSEGPAQVLQDDPVRLEVRSGSVVHPAAAAAAAGSSPPS